MKRANFELKQRWLAAIGVGAAVGVGYLVAARLSQVLLTEPDGVAVFWPAAGLSAASIIVLGRRARWPVFAGIVTANLILHRLTDGVTLLAAVFALSDAGEAVLTAWLVGRFVDGEFNLQTLRQVLWLLAVAVVGAAGSGLVSTLGVVLLRGPAAPFAVTWWHWSSSNATGIITTAPLIFGLASLCRAPPPRRQVLEGAAALVAVVAAMVAIVFFLPRIWWHRIAPVELLLPLLLWIAARCRPAFTAAAVFVICLLIACALVFKLGHYGYVGPSEVQGVLATRAALLGVAIFSYILAALFAERRQAEETQRTLTSELQHRTNNLLTVVQLIANRTICGNDPLKEKAVLDARLRALARANKQLTDSDWSGLTLAEIIGSELEPHMARCDLQGGGDIVLDRQQAQNFSLVLHELVTNAIKYGALSNRQGRVHIAWDRKGNGWDSRLVFHWQEQGGPAVVAPGRQGFGSKLLNATFAGARCRFEASGFSCQFETPLRECAPSATAGPRRPEAGYRKRWSRGSLAG